MDPLLRKPGTSLSSVPRWSPEEVDDPLSAHHENGSSSPTSYSRFPFRVELNRRIALWKGPITRLEVDAIVNSSNEPLTDISTIGQLVRTRQFLRITDSKTHALLRSTRRQALSCRGRWRASRDAEQAKLNSPRVRAPKLSSRYSRFCIGYALPARHVIHTVGPRFNIKYKTAAENALHNCYRSAPVLVTRETL